MLSSREVIEVITKCQICNKESNVSRILPCGDAVCTDCLMSQGDQDKFNCSSCNLVHEILAKEPVKPMSQFSPSVFFSKDKIKDFVSLLKTLEESTNTFKDKLSNSEEVIVDRCNQMIHEVKNQQVKAASHIETLAASHLEKIENYKTDTLTNYEKNFKALVDERKEFIDKWSKNLQRADFDETVMDSAIDLCKALQSALDKEQEDLDGFIFNHKVIKLEDNFKEIEEKGIGALTIKHSDLTKFQNMKAYELHEYKNLSANNIHVFENGNYVLAQTVNLPKVTDTTNIYTFDKNFNRLSHMNLNLQLISSAVYKNSVLVWSYHESDHSQNVFRVFDESLEMLAEKYDLNVISASADSTKVYVLSNNRSMDVYDWDLNLIISIKQPNYSNYQYYIPSNANQVMLFEEKIAIIKPGHQVNVMKKKDGSKLSSFSVSSDRNLVMDRTGLLTATDLKAKKLLFYNLDGKLEYDYDSEYVPLNIVDFKFIFDESNRIQYFDTKNQIFYKSD